MERMKQLTPTSSSAALSHSARYSPAAPTRTAATLTQARVGGPWNGRAHSSRQRVTREGSAHPSSRTFGQRHTTSSASSRAHGQQHTRHFGQQPNGASSPSGTGASISIGKERATGSVAVRIQVVHSCWTRRHRSARRARNQRSRAPPRPGSNVHRQLATEAGHFGRRRPQDWHVIGRLW